MGTTAEKLQAVLDSKAAIKTAIEGKGQVVGSIPFSGYAPLIDAIETGGSGGSQGTSQFYLNKCILTVDNGYQFERIPISAGDVIDLGEGADVEASTNWGSYYHAKSHPAMTFQGWSSSIEITNNQFVVPDNLCTDFHVGMDLVTADGLNYLTKFTTGVGYEVETFEDSEVTTSYTTSNYGSNIFTGQVTAVWLGASATSIGSAAFYGCTSLAAINIPSAVKSIDGYAFYGCTSLAAINIPSAVKSIAIYAFYGCTSLAAINIPSGITNITQSCFENCKALSSIHIPEAVVNIYAYSFRYCGSLRNFIIPSSVAFLGVQVLASTEIFSCIAQSSTPITLSTTTIIPTTTTILVPYDSVSTYQAATNWSTYSILADTEENRKLFGIW